MPVTHKSLNISVTSQMDAYVKAKVAGGAYQSASEVIREAILALQKQEQADSMTLHAIRSKLTSGLAQAERGELKDGDAIFDALERGLNQFARKVPSKSSATKRKKASHPNRR